MSRRDHVLNLLPPLTVVNKEDATMHDRLFSDDPPPKNYSANFPSKVLRHLGAWTFYSAPTKGELALLDKNMYDLEKDAEKLDKTDGEEKKNNTNTEYKTEQGRYHKHTSGTQSHSVSDDKKRLEARKSKDLKEKNETPIQQTTSDEKESQREKNNETKQQNPSLPPQSPKSKSSEPNSPKKTKKSVTGNKSNETEAAKKTIKRRSHITHASKKLQKTTQVKSKLQAPLAQDEITLKKSRGKVLGGAETGIEISVEALSVEGHNMSVPGPDGQHTKEGTGNIEETTKFKTTERNDSKFKKRSRSLNSDLDINRTENSTSSEETQSKNLKKPVIKIPLQENDSSEEGENNNRTVTPHADDVKSHNTVDSLQSESEPENVSKPEVTSENQSQNETLCDRRVTFGVTCEKGPEIEKKRAKSQAGRKREGKRSGKNRVKSS